jgi:hypothetical protein
MSARYVSSTLIKNVSKGGKSVAVEYVDKTTAWVRPAGFPSNSVKEEFAEVAIANVDSFKPDATRIAMKYVLELCTNQSYLDAHRETGSPSIRVTKMRECITLPTD